MVKAFWVLCLYRRRPVLVGFEPDGQASAAFAVVSPALAAPLVAAVVVRAEPVVAEPVAPVGSAPEPVHDAFVVAVAAAEQLRAAVVPAVVVVVVLVLRLFRLAAVVVVLVAPHVQLAPRRLHARLDAVHAAVEPVEPAVEEQLVVFGVVPFAPFVVHRVHVARLSPGTSVPSHDRGQYSRANPLRDLDGMAVLQVSCW